MAEPKTPTESAAEPATERVHPRTTDLDRQPLGAILERIVDEDARVPLAVRAALSDLESAAKVLHRSLAMGGRWYNVGAGTSGRVGMMDAVELPPTFGLEPERVQAIVAGGSAALERAVEGAEDDCDAGRAAIRERAIGERDAVVGLSASGRTPFVLAALEAARAAGARTIAITCDAASPLARAAEISIALDVGPEVISGSTRMKGGLAQKMALHALSTAVMVRMGRVRGNLMAEIRITNEKLRRRAVRIIARLAHSSREQAERALAAANGSVPDALEALGVPRRRIP
jgi:N-acetylmuramic acid 6-phosphate etherase